MGTGQFALHPFPLVNFRLELLVDPADGIVALLHAQGRRTRAARISFP